MLLSQCATLTCDRLYALEGRPSRWSIMAASNQASPYSGSWQLKDGWVMMMTQKDIWI